MITSLVVSGYRSIGQELHLEVGPVICLYGKNGAGKSNVLRAVKLLGSLVRADLQTYLHPTPVRAEAWFEHHGEDPWMFSQQGGERTARVGCTTEAGVEVLFEVVDDGDAITTKLLAWRHGDTDHLATMTAAAVVEASEWYQDPFHDKEPTIVEVLAPEWAAVGAELSVSPGLITADLPVPQEVRERVAALARSVQPTENRRFQRIRDWLTQLAPPGDPEKGQFRDVDNPPLHPIDFAWSDDRGVLPLDSLGSGFQVLFMLLAGLLDGGPERSAPPAIALLEEPENRLHPPLQTQIVRLLRDMIEHGVVRQLWVATHSVALAAPEFTCVHLERRDGLTAARAVTSADLRLLELHADHAPDGRVSVVNADHQIRLPSYVLEALKVGPGSLVYFVRDGAGFRLVEGEELHAAIGLDP